MIEIKESKLKIDPGNGMPLGAYILDERRIQFSIFRQDVKSLNLYLFTSKNQNEATVLNLNQKFRMGSIFSIVVTVLDSSQCEYIYETNGEFFCDPYARQITGRELWGKNYGKTQKETMIRCKVVAKGQDEHRNISVAPIYQLNELFIYRFHVRGFTMDSGSEVSNKGTFKGIIEKIQYLKELGVNAVEMMPCYEFDEMMQTQCQTPYGITSSITQPVYMEEMEEEKWKVNYWGYTDKSYYFAPKTSFSCDKQNPCQEFKELVNALHENKIEVYMEFFFGFNTNQNLIVDCIRFWHQEYKVDGFKLNKEWVPEKLLATDPLLGQVKLFTSDWNLSYLYPDGRFPKEKRLVDNNDSFMTIARRYLKGDEEQVQNFTNQIRENPAHKGKVNYLANTNSMTVMDMVSFDVKHNEENGENGHDGTNYNYSWNCGYEGKTRRKNVIKLRKRQIKNAFIMLFFSQGIPLVMAGDEFGNSQKGNNNPYCIDGPISWINWKEEKKNKWIFDFVKELASFREKHKILHMENSLRMMDYISCGSPDLSFHGTKPWYPDYSNYSRELGVLLSGRYAVERNKECDCDIYIIFNYHWEPHVFSLPVPRKGMAWNILIDTSEMDCLQECDNLVSGKSYTVKERTVVVFTSVNSMEKSKEKK